VYGASERDYQVLVVSDAISGIEPHHLEEASRMGVVAAPGSEVTEYLAVCLARGASGDVEMA
jgi:hypothetical protein